jgi:DNA-binding NarL/FixJ family response regulator
LPTTNLTDTELEIAAYVHQGYETKEIAVFRGVKKATIQNQLGKIYQKLLFPPDRNDRVMLAVWYGERLRRLVRFRGQP